MSPCVASSPIRGPIDAVWNVLTDVEQMPDWTPSMRSVRILDEPVPGHRHLRRGSRVQIKQPWLRQTVWTVELFDPPRFFSWRSRVGLVETVGEHLLEEQGPATTHAIFSLSHRGPGAGLVAQLLAPLIRSYVTQELHGLKRRMELR